MVTTPDMLASRRLRAYLYAAFRRIGGISEKSLGTALEDEFPAGYPPLLREKRAKRKNARDIRDHGYYPAANALWMTRSYLTRKTRNDKTFDDGNKRDVRLREIIRSELDAWLSGHIDLTADLQPVDRVSWNCSWLVRFGRLMTNSRRLIGSSSRHLWRVRPQRQFCNRLRLTNT